MLETENETETENENWDTKCTLCNSDMTFDFVDGMWICNECGLELMDVR